MLKAGPLAGSIGYRNNDECQHYSRQDGKPQHTGPSHPSTKSQLNVACSLLGRRTSVRPAAIRRYRKVRHTQVALRHAIVWQLCYPSKMAPRIVVKLAFSPRRHFFNWGFAMSYPILWKTDNAGDSSSSSLGSRCIPRLGEGLSMSSPNDPVLCCPRPYRVAPVFFQDRLSTAWLVSLVVFSCHMVSKWWRARSIGRLWGG